MFAGFVDGDFDAYQERKWLSNAFNRERLEVKQKLLGLGREVAPALARAGLLLTCEASAEHPALWNHKRVEAQHLYFVRGGEERKALEHELARSRGLAAMLSDPSPVRNHIVLGVTIDQAQVEVALRLSTEARIDRENLERKLDDPWERVRFVQTIKALGPDFQVRVQAAAGPSTAGPLSAPTAAATTFALNAAELDDLKVRELCAALQKKADWLTIGQSFDRNDPRLREPGFAQAVHRLLLALAPVYQFIAWTRTNDKTALTETLREEKQVKKQKGLSKNDRVKIVSGVFAGKAGVVQDIDAKGQLKVLVGKLAVKVDASEVAKG